MKKSLLVILSIYLILNFVSIKSLYAQNATKSEFNCFSILVGKNASLDGSVMFAHNEDDAGDQLVNFYKVPRLKHEQGETITTINGAVIPQVAETNSFLWLEMPEMEFSDSYLNEWGVAIASDACASRQENSELKDGGITYWLRRLVAERAKSAKHGVKIAGQLIEEFGYGSSGRTYVIADRNEGWLLAAVFGKHWVAQRVPDDHVAVLPNYYTIGEIDLSDTTNFLGAADLIEYATKNNWYNPAHDGKFHFARAYSDTNNLKSKGNIHRMWRGINLIAGKNFAINDCFPFSLKPEKKISLPDLMSVLRDHYEGTELDNSQHYSQGNPYQLNHSTICAGSTQYGFIAQLRHWLPVDIGAVLWLAPRRPDAQAFMPWYFGMNKLPEGFCYDDWQSALTHHFEPPASYYDQAETHAFWTYVHLAQWVDEDYAERIQLVRQGWEKLENQTLNNQQHFEKKVIYLYQENPQAARNILTVYSNELIEETVKRAKNFSKK